MHCLREGAGEIDLVVVGGSVVVVVDIVPADNIVVDAADTTAIGPL